jgi:hypothetical protein
MLDYNMNNNNSGFLVIVAWFNAGLGYLFSEPVISTIAYCFSIAGSCVYIYSHLKKNKSNEKNT